MLGIKRFDVNPKHVTTGSCVVRSFSTLGYTRKGRASNTCIQCEPTKTKHSYEREYGPVMDMLLTLLHFGFVERISHRF